MTSGNITAARKQASSGAPGGVLRFEGVQVLRGLAASMVVFHHFCWVIAHYHHGVSRLVGFHRLAEVGAGGVDIFFCISGLVIGYSARTLAAGAAPAASFIGRRIARVLPPYWVFTTGLVGLWAVGIGLKGLIVTPWLLLASYLLIPFPKTTVYGDYSLHPILDIGWTLSFEMYFYALCALVILTGGGRRVFPRTLAARALLAGQVWHLAAATRSPPRCWLRRC